MAQDIARELEEFKQSTEAKFVRSEVRLFAILENLYKAFSAKKYKHEAMLALLSWFISRRALTVLTIGAGGVLALLVAMEANELSYIQNELSEGTRRSATNIELTNVLDLIAQDVKKLSDQCSDTESLRSRYTAEQLMFIDKMVRNDFNGGGYDFYALLNKLDLLNPAELPRCVSRSHYNENPWVNNDSSPYRDILYARYACMQEGEECIPLNIKISYHNRVRLIALTHALRPYRYLTRSECKNVSSLEQSWLNIKKSLTNSPYSLGCLQLSSPLSPERGQILTILSAYRALHSSGNPKDYDFQHADFEHKKLNNMDLSNLNLEGASFKSSTLTNISFTFTDLGYTDFRQVVANNVDFRAAYITGADFTDADLRNSFFTVTDATDAKFTRANLTEARTNDTIYTRNEAGMGTQKVFLDGADFTHALFYERDLENLEGEADAIPIIDLLTDKQVYSACVGKSFFTQYILPKRPQMVGYRASPECLNIWNWTDIQNWKEDKAL